MYRYLPFEGECFSPSLGRYRSFGLRALRETPERDEELMLLPDISTDFAFVLRLAHLLTRRQLPPTHLLDAMEDLL